MLDLIGGTTVLNFILINAALALSIYVTLYTGLLSVANAGFMAIGAYAAAIVALRLGWPPQVALPAALMIGALLAWALGRLVLGLRDVYLAIATLGFGEIVRIAVLNGDGALALMAGEPVAVLHGAEGMTLPYRSPVLWLGLPTDTWWLLAYLAAAAYTTATLQRSRFGRVLAAIRMDEPAASTLGIDVVKYKLLVFVLGSMMAAGAGVLSAPVVHVVHPGSYTFSRAVDVLSFTVLGGMQHWVGPIVGAAVLTWLPESLRFMQDQTPIVTGVIIMMAIVFLPRGLADGRFWRRLVAVRRAGASAPAPRPNRHVEGRTFRFGQATPTRSVLLSIHNLTRRFGGLVALDDVAFDVAAGSVCALIGPNGAGKTTLINVLSGLTPASGGRIILAADDVTGRPPREMARLGVARTFQHIRLFADLTVIDNVVVGRHLHRRAGLVAALLHLRASRDDDRRAREDAADLLDRLGLTDLAALPAGTLSYGDQRRVEIARALATAPRLLLLDEPAAGLNPSETRRLAAFLQTVVNEGVTLIVIEHDMELVHAISDHVVVLNFGRKIAEGTPASIRDNPAVVEAYLGAPEA
jgi:branched-chain amino acid transport system permease protein